MTAAIALDPLAELLVLIASGHEGAFTEFYSATRVRVSSIVDSVLRNSAISAEVTQDVFFELWRCASRYDSAAGSVMAWTSTIARRRAIDRVRHEESSRRRDTRYVEDRRPTGPDDYAGVDRAVDGSRVTSALQELTGRQRQAVELAYVYGLANAEIAVLLGIPLGTTKTRIRDGLIRLRAVLNE